MITEPKIKSLGNMLFEVESFTVPGKTSVSQISSNKHAHVRIFVFAG